MLINNSYIEIRMANLPEKVGIIKVGDKVWWNALFYVWQRWIAHEIRTIVIARNEREAEMDCRSPNRVLLAVYPTGPPPRNPYEPQQFQVAYMEMIPDEIVESQFPNKYPRGEGPGHWYQNGKEIRYQFLEERRTMK